MKKSDFAYAYQRPAPHKNTAEHFTFSARLNANANTKCPGIIIIQILYKILFQLQCFITIVFYLEVQLIGCMTQVDLVFIQ